MPNNFNSNLPLANSRLPWGHSRRILRENKKELVGGVFAPKPTHPHRSIDRQTVRAIEVAQANVAITSDQVSEMFGWEN